MRCEESPEARRRPMPEAEIFGGEVSLAILQRFACHPQCRRRQGTDAFLIFKLLARRGTIAAFEFAERRHGAAGSSAIKLLQFSGHAYPSEFTPLNSLPF